MGVEVTQGPPKADEIKVTSAPAVTGSLTPEERRQRYDALRARMGRPMSETTPPAGKAGYWARINDAPEMGRLEYLGFKIVKDDPKHPAWKANGLKEDGTYVIGDVILMEIDADIYEFLLNENVERGREMIEGASESFKLEAQRQGVPTFDVNKPASNSKGR
jgi:hypothetical protein